MLKIFFTFILFFSLHHLHLNAENISVMSINAQNLFDTIDDPGKDDKAFLLSLIHISEPTRRS